MRDLTRYLVGLALVGLALTGCSDSGTTAGETEDIQVGEEVNPTFVEPEVTVADDVPLVEPELPPVDPGCEPGSGCFGEPCSEADDCLSGICGQHMGDGACTETCDEACPEGWSCSQVSLGSSDTTFICVSDHTHLCRPCGDVGDCAGQGAEDACVIYPDEGAFCGSTCDEERPCPQGFSCVESELTSGGTGAQCVADAGVCPCSDTAIELGLSTPCEVSNDSGACGGLRICGPQGLGACDAPEPAPETCDGVDEDCDGEVDEGTCDDGNPCTVDVCGGETGCTNEPITDEACDDGDACTTGDACQAGACVGEAVVCQDGNPCTDDACDEVFGCSFQPNSAPCDDGDPCTLADTCEDSACESGVSVQCDDGNPCTDDACDEAQGCLHTPNAGDCDDQNACTQGDICTGGACVSTGLVDCDDGQLCTTDSCEPATGCLSVPNTLPCDDADVCTLTDACAGGACVAGNALECDDGNPCTTDVCNPITGCQYTLNTEPCDDGDPCTADDHCAGGVCAASQPLDCGDGNPCTTDVCVPFAGCSYEPNAAPCDDEDVCTVGDVCAGNSCVSGSLDLACDDGNPCTDDVCDPLVGCLHTANGDGCDDLNACTTGDVCSEGACGGVGSLACDDGNPCTLDVCLPDGGCDNQAVDGPCSDGDPCTVDDVCDAGQCVPGAPRDCDDGNPCTVDLCGADGTCVLTADDAGICDDGNPCTVGDHCDGGACAVDGPLDCADDNPCTTNFCDPLQGCQSVANEAPCSDDDVCTTSDVCSDGACVGSGGLTCDDGNPCTDDSCDPAGGCVFTHNDDGCDDQNACTTDDHCQGGACVAGGALACGDDNPCTDDACDPGSGCTNENNTAPCDDLNACTPVDICADGGCEGTGALNCNDGEVCTDDACDPAFGCVNTNNTVGCDDLNACTVGDLCDGGVCTSGLALDCSDEEVCTDNICDAAQGCVVTNNTNPCDDLSACTVGDTCANGGCVGGPALDCDDSEVCTDDACDPAFGCVNLNNTDGCEDGDLCTEGDLCADGDCSPGPQIDCDDGDSCTADSCQDGGCVYTPQSPCYGAASDGDLSVSGTFFVDSVKTRLQPTASVGETTVNVDSSVGFEDGDFALIITLQGTNVGAFQVNRLSGVNGNTLELVEPLEHDFTASATMVQRMPQFGDVTVENGGIITAEAWDGQLGGVVAFVATGTVTVNASGRIDAKGLGFRGGAGGVGVCSTGTQGESFGVFLGNLTSNNEGGGGAGQGQGDRGNSGGGGGYGSPGVGGTDVNGSTVTEGGGAYGHGALTSLFFGSGGGGGGTDCESDGSGSTAGSGGNGGGIILIQAPSISPTNDAPRFLADGQDGGAANPGPNGGETGGGGGGSGGSVLFLTEQAGSITALVNGANGGNSATDGGGQYGSAKGGPSGPGRHNTRLP